MSRKVDTLYYCVHCKSNNIEPWIVEDRGFGNNQYYWCNDCDQET